MEAETQIIGLGLAGACLAWHLLAEGRDVTIVDRERPGAATRVAAGLFTPITGKRMALVWQANRVLPYARRFYEEVEAATGESFYHPSPSLRIFDTPEERAAWEQRRDRPDLQAYVEREWDQVKIPGVPGLRENHGGLSLRESGWVDLPVFLAAVRARFKRLGIVRAEPLPPESVQRTIYCEGHRISENPHFAFLPFRMNKGDILDVTFAESIGIGNTIVHCSGIYVLPTGERTARVGGSFLRDFTHREPDATTRRELEDKLRALIDIPFIIDAHRSGIRPSTTHFRPVLGLLPDNPRIGVFNSLGSKGVLFAPAFARQLTRHFLEGGALDPEVDIEVYARKYGDSG